MQKMNDKINSMRDEFQVKENENLEKNILLKNANDEIQKYLKLFFVKNYFKHNTFPFNSKLLFKENEIKKLNEDIELKQAMLGETLEKQQIYFERYVT